MRNNSTRSRCLYMQVYMLGMYEYIMHIRVCYAQMCVLCTWRKDKLAAFLAMIILFT